MSADGPKSAPPLPEELEKALEGLRRTGFSRRLPASKEESESPVYWGVKDLGDLTARIARNRPKMK